MTISYADSPYPVRDDLVAAHERFWRRLAAPGAWWTGAERIAIAGEVRRARDCELCRRRKQALSPYHVSGTHDRAGVPAIASGGGSGAGSPVGPPAGDMRRPRRQTHVPPPDMRRPRRQSHVPPPDMRRPRRQSHVPPGSAIQHFPEAAVDAVHRIVTDASRLKQEWLLAAYEAGLDDGRYVELVGTVVSLVSIDSFCLALGLAEHPLPEPVAGEPSGYRPAAARMEGAWVPVVPEDNAGTPEEDLWPPRRTGWVIRAMSLVPDEVRTLNDLSAAHYLPMRDVANPAAQRGALSRSQMELVAGRVSALNDCFY